MAHSLLASIRFRGDAQRLSRLVVSKIMYSVSNGGKLDEDAAAGGACEKSMEPLAWYEDMAAVGDVLPCCCCCNMC